MVYFRREMNVYLFLKACCIVPNLGILSNEQVYYVVCVHYSTHTHTWLHLTLHITLVLSKQALTQTCWVFARFSMSTTWSCHLCIWWIKSICIWLPLIHFWKIIYSWGKKGLNTNFEHKNLFNTLLYEIFVFKVWYFAIWLDLIEKNLWIGILRAKDLWKNFIKGRIHPCSVHTACN